MKKYIIPSIAALWAMFAPFQSFAQEAATAATEKVVEKPFWDFVTADPMMTFVSVMLAVLVILVLATSLIALAAVKLVLYPEKANESTLETLFKVVDKKFISGDILPVERDEEIMLDHNYDGIRELDNFMPPWLQWLFIGSIIWGAFYVINVFYIGSIKPQKQEYKEEMAAAKVEVDAYLAKAANSIDEKSVKLVTDKPAIDAGAKLFQQNCKTCHGAAAEGGAGPNLTDVNWIHGGTVNDVFKTIKYGVPAKSMPEWQKKLKPLDIQNLASYILSLKGSNPANAKAPQGDIIVN